MMKYAISTALFIALLSALQAQIGIELNLQPDDCFCEGTPQQPFSVTAEGSAGPFTYEWSSPNGYSSTAKEPDDIVLAGEYTLEVYNAYACSFTYSVVLEACDKPQVDINPHGCLQQISLSIETDEDNPPVSIAWYEEGVDTPLDETGTTLSGMPDGQYYAEVTFSNGCTYASEVVDYTFTTEVNYNVATQITPVSCPEGSDGRVEAYVINGGTPPYSIIWFDENSQQLQVGGNVLQDIPAGEYRFAIEDADGCSSSLMGPLTVEEPQDGMEITADISEACPGQSTGSISLDVSGGSPPYSYIWSNGATSVSVSGVPVDDYSVTITDDSNCSLTRSFQVPQSDELSVVVTEVEEDSCFGEEDGSITVSISGGVPPYSIQWYNVSVHPMSGEFSFNPIVGAETEVISGISAGSYSFEITDDNGCIYAKGEQIESISQPAAIGISAEVTPACIGGTNGEIALMVTGGSPPYTYEWSDGASGLIRISLGLGDYEVTVTDANNCQSTAVYTIEEDTDFEILSNILETQPCPGSYLGEIIIGNSSGGTEPYNYTWSTGETGPQLDNLIAGSYTVTISDADACMDEQTIVLANDDPSCNDNGVDCEGTSLIGRVYTEKTCVDESFGAISLRPFDYDQIVSYEWDNGATTADIFNLSAGEYCVTVTGVNGCVEELCIVVELIDISTLLTVTLDAEEASNPTSSDGSIDATVSGGADPYDYSWTGPNGFTANTEDISGLVPGVYTLEVTSASPGYCFWGSETVIVGDGCPEIIIFGIAHNGFIQCEGDKGELGVAYFEDEAAMPYSIEWSNGETTETISNLDPGYYSVTVTNAFGCSDQTGIHLNVLNPPIEFSSQVIQSCNEESGSISIDVTDGTPPYTFDWDNGADDKLIEGLADGEYCVTITDGAGCSKEECFTIEHSDLELVDISSQDNDCGTDCNGSITLNVNASQTPTYSWSNNANGPSIDGLCSGAYTVTVSAGACTQEFGANVGGVAEGFEYTVEVIRRFNYDGILSDDALVRIYSEQFAGGGNLDVSYTSGINPIIAEGFGGYNGQNYVNVQISEMYSWVELYHFEFVHANGCIYTGTFEGIEPCSLPEAGLTFTVELIGNWQKTCGDELTNSFSVDIHGVIGLNTPYYIEVTMVEAYDSQHSDFKFIKEIDPEVDPGIVNGFDIEGIPDGIVKFRSYNKCSNDNFVVREETTCCMDFPCNELDEVIYTDNGYNPGDGPGGDKSYNFPYFTLEINDECYDGNCAGGSSCSDIVVKPNGTTHFDNCWKGTFRITFPNGVVASYDVIDSPDNDVYDLIVESSEHVDDNWNPSGVGSHNVQIEYIGLDESHVSCNTTFKAEFFGDSNYSDGVVYIYDGIWFDYSWNIPEIFHNSYFLALKCELCSGNASYFYSEDDPTGTSCNQEGGFVPKTYFDFVPNELYSENPCNSGGELTLMELDANGIAEINTSITIPENVQAIAHQPDLEPLGVYGKHCDVTGWCLFEPDDITLASGIPFDRPVVAGYLDEDTCEDAGGSDPNDPNASPCSEENPCDFGFGCYEGNCYEECFNGQCPVGSECIQGVCVPTCEPNCPNGWYCHDGECLIDGICSFEEFKQNGNGTETYNFYHELNPGSTVYFRYKTFSLGDKFDFGGDLSGNPSINCVSTGTDWSPPESESPITLTVNTNVTNKITIAVSSSACSNETSRYKFRLSCDPNYGGATQNLTVNSTLDNESKPVNFRPNPFREFIEIELSEELYVEKKNIEIAVYNNFGRQVAYKELDEVNQGQRFIRIDEVKNLVSGIYFVVVRKNAELIASDKLIKME